MIRILVNGALGKMGAETVKAVSGDAGLVLVAKTDATDDLTSIIKEAKPEVAVEFTHPACVKNNVELLLRAGVRPVVGTTGLSAADLADLDALARSCNLGVLVAPNFAIGAVLMMKFAATAAQYMPRVEILEFHHDQKADAPSGTAVKTADLIAETYEKINDVVLDEKELVVGARGGNYRNIPIHSIRLPGFVASQEVIFGGLGQTLKLRHDSISRDSFMPGVLIAIRKVQEITGLVYGLENVL